ncbi:MAG: citrate lyase holo-[acyl-carrier protein] synthase, partial [Firmicutes bacterium]|nr:citrate lyase holo-[acyl-carrier protein] synthase [Bacillota bacterium]
NTSCLISFTLNIPGAQKQFPLAKAAYNAGLETIHSVFAGYIIYEEHHESVTGNESILVLSYISAKEAKRRAICVESAHPLGRLFDIDIINPDGLSISRSVLGFPPRRCMLCGDDAKVCARSQRHAPESLQEHIITMILNFLAKNDAENSASCALRALLYEVSVTPKPGLVDRLGNGSHTDMDFYTFLDSTAALAPEFSKLFQIGWENALEPPSALFEALRLEGMIAETKMFNATHNVNTHKGLIFSLAIILGALGSLRRNLPLVPIPVNSLTEKCGLIASFSEMDLHNENFRSSHGLNCYKSFQVRGVRGEAADGFPTVIRTALPTLREAIATGLHINDAAAITLLTLIAETQDTNMIHRGGKDRANAARTEAAQLLKLPRDKIAFAAEELDRVFIAHNLSPGGCADLLAITLFLLFLDEKQLITLDKSVPE